VSPSSRRRRRRLQGGLQGLRDLRRLEDMTWQFEVPRNEAAEP
jgi:hypothetical protein